MTIDDLIRELEKAKRAHGGAAEICIKDADTGCHMAVLGIRESNNEPGRALLIPEEYADYFDRT